MEHYQLLSDTSKIFSIPIDTKEEFDILRNPSFTEWLEEILTTTTFEPFVIINSKRYSNENKLFSNETGEIQVYKLNNETIKTGQLPDWIKKQLPKELKMSNEAIATVIKREVSRSIRNKPWLNLTNKRRDILKANLDNIGNWSFRLTRNEGLHSYPGTFVHAIPATLITALGLKGGTIYDPFGGTGQTASEAIKLSCRAITTDSNTIATMIAKAKFTYYSIEQRNFCLNVNETDIRKVKGITLPSFEGVDKWHHSQTIIELAKIRKYISTIDDNNVQLFLTVCFSDILTACTARKGKEHGYFADNTPLSKGTSAPPYENAIVHFLNKIR